MAGTNTTLDRYWTFGKGGAKIRWGTDGDFRRCVRAVDKYAAEHGFSPEGYCNRLHKIATGMYPGDKRNTRKS